MKKYIIDNSFDDLIIKIKAHNYYTYKGDMSTGIAHTPYNKTSIMGKCDYLRKNIRISYVLPSRGMVSIHLYDSRGIIIKKVLKAIQNAGKHRILFTGDNLSSGVYYCRLVSLNSSFVKKFIVTN